MGASCDQGSDPQGTEIIIPKDIQIPQYDSKNEKFYKKFDKEFNLLSNVPLSDFIMNISKFRLGAPLQEQVITIRLDEDSKQRIFTEEIDPASAMIFFEKKIAKNFLLYEDFTEEKTQIFLEFINGILGTCASGYSSYMKKFRYQIISKEKIKKVYLYALGFLFCHSDNISKVSALFGLFSNEQNKFERCQNFENFLYLLIYISSFGHFHVITELQPKYPNQIATLSLEEQNDIFQFAQAEKFIKLRNDFLSKLFINDNSLPYSEFLEKFSSGNISWILFPSGIRSSLEQQSS